MAAWLLEAGLSSEYFLHISPSARIENHPDGQQLELRGSPVSQDDSLAGSHELPPICTLLMPTEAVDI